MSTTRTLSWNFPATPREVLTRCGDPAVAQARAQADPILVARVVDLRTDSPDGAVLVVTMAGAIPTTWIPSRLTSRMGSSGNGGPGITRSEAWYLDDDGSAYAAVTFDFTGVPATTMTGSARLTPTAGGSQLTYRLELDVAIPLVGGAVESTVLSQVAGAFDKEADVIAAHL